MTLTSWARLVLVLLAGLVLQVAVVDQVTVLGAHADLMVLLAAAAGLVAGPERGGLVGFVVGLVADLVVTTPYGLSSLTFVLIGFGFGLLHRAPSSREGRTAQVAACVAAGAAGTVLFAFLGALVGQSGMLGRTAVDAVVVVTLGAVVLAWPALWAIRWSLGSAERAAAGYGVPSGGSATL
ncbi:MAG: rod shape-determining protein MreD [Actinomycetota bacterium]|nr:rod shape-determining protein MreD [Actinomycetota bacterium]